MRDVSSLAKVLNGITPQVITSGGGAKNTGNIDVRGFAGLLFAVHFGANGGDTLNGTNKFTVLLQDADDDGAGSPDSYGSVDTDDVVGVTPASGIVVTVDDAAEDDAVYQFAYVGDKRFVKLTVTPNGTLTNGNPVCVSVTKLLPQFVPTP